MSRKKVTIGVFSDTHNGYSGNASLHNEFGELRTEKTTEDGMNIRTQDVNDAFQQSVDIFKEEGVDIVLHGGDGMNFWGYKHPVHFNFYMEQVNRLASSGIKYVEIAGNHNFAKKSGVGCELQKLNLLENVNTVYRGVYENIDFEELGLTIHALPSSFSKEIFDEEFKNIQRKDGFFNIFLTHCGVTTIDHYARSENAIVLHLDDIKSLNMDLTILGDYHKFVDFGDNIYYPGATERFSFGEVNEIPRVLIFDLDLETGKTQMKTRYLDVRPMLDLKKIDAKGKKIAEIQEKIIDRLKNNPIKDAIVRLRVENLSKTMKHRHILLTDEILELQEQALIFKLEFKNKTELSDTIKTDSDIEFEGVFDGFEEFVGRIEENPNVPREKIIEYGKKYLMEVIEDEDH